MSEEALLAPEKERLVSLDVFRGITIAGMILVNHPGSFEHVYEPLDHAPWNGWTPTDLIFPFFLFMVGVAMTFSFDRRIARGHNRMRLFEHVARRSIILVMLGLTMNGLPDIRLVGPFVLVIVGLWFLFAHDHLRNALRTFVPARIQAVRPTGKTFARPQRFSLEKTLRDSFGVHSGQGNFPVVIFPPFGFSFDLYQLFFQ